MSKPVNRGFVIEDRREFSDKEIERLRKAQKDLIYLIDNGYDIEKSVTFIGNTFQFSTRQRMALTRSTTKTISVIDRELKRKENIRDKTVYIDGFNLVITLEAAQSEETTLLACMDGTIRDLCGLRGTYRVIDSTYTALSWIFEELTDMGVKKVHFFLDSPISNSGRLKEEILKFSDELETEVTLVKNADAMLWGKENVVTSDAIILDKCISWVNLSEYIIEKRIKDRRICNLMGDYGL